MSLQCSKLKWLIATSCKNTCVQLPAVPGALLSRPHVWKEQKQGGRRGQSKHLGVCACVVINLTVLFVTLHWPCSQNCMLSRAFSEKWSKQKK